MCKKTLIPLLSILAFIVGVGNYAQLQAQAKDPMVGGTWERYSVKNAQGDETGGGPGWFFMAFTDDGQYFLAAAPKGMEKLPKAAKDMTKEELVKHVEAVSFRRGTYTFTGTAAPYTLDLMELAKIEAPTLRRLVFQVWIENNDDLRLMVKDASTELRWRRVRE